MRLQGRRPNYDLFGLIYQTLKTNVCTVSNVRVKLQITYRENDVHDDMECDKTNQNPVEPIGQLSLGQFHGEENGDN